MQQSFDNIRALLQQLITRYAAAIEYWTVACLSRGDLGDPREFIDSQWTLMNADLHEVRQQVVSLPFPASPIATEQLARMVKVLADLREVFDSFLNYDRISREELEIATLKLGLLWKELRLRITLTAATIPLPAPLPAITLDQEAYYQHILDGLFDRYSQAATA